MHVSLKSRHLASLEKAEEGEATGCRLYCCMLNTQVTHLWPHAADQEQEINFVWPKVEEGARWLEGRIKEVLLHSTKFVQVELKLFYYVWIIRNSTVCVKSHQNSARRLICNWCFNEVPTLPNYGIVGPNIDMYISHTKFVGGPIEWTLILWSNWAQSRRWRFLQGRYFFTRIW